MKKYKTLLLTGVFIFTSVLSCVGFADESTFEGETLTQGVYSYDVETQTETYEEITFDEESQQAYVSYSSESDVVKTDEGYEVEFDESALVNEYVENEFLDAEENGSDISPYDIVDTDNRKEVLRPDQNGKYRNTCRLVITDKHSSLHNSISGIL